MGKQMMLHIIPALKDNYIWLLETSNQHVIIVDPNESQPVIDYLNQKQLIPITILLTHHHHDHIDGVMALKNYYPNLPVYGPNEINLPINHITDHSEIMIDNQIIKIIAVPGHTIGHLAYYCKPYLFCGDTLFSAGCGRIFEGTYQQMFNSLNKLKQLPNSTIVCPAHEYTLSNLEFSRHILPNDEDINAYYQQIKHQTITLPSTIGKEKRINLFLLCDEAFLQKQFNMQNALDLFKFFRTQKDNF